MNIFRTTIFTVLIFATQTAFAAEMQTYNEEANRDALNAIHEYHYHNAEGLGSKENHEKLLNTLPSIIIRGANPNLIINEIGDTLFLFVSTLSEDGAMVKELLEQGECINSHGGLTEKTALIRACSRGLYQVVEILLLAGADKTCTDSLGYTARYWAERGFFVKRKDREKCIALLDTIVPKAR